MLKAARYCFWLLAATACCLAPGDASARGPVDYDTARQWHGFRRYYNHPYYYSYGSRYDPHWSYSSSYFPYQYQNDGSYYGLGYSGYGGDGWYGSYWYW